MTCPYDPNMNGLKYSHTKLDKAVNGKWSLKKIVVKVIRLD